MSESMNDSELNELLREKLLASDSSDKLMDMHAEVVFAGKTSITPPLLKEKELFSKLGAKAASKFSIGWIFTSLSAAAAIIITSVAFVMNSGAEENKKPISVQRLQPATEVVEQVIEAETTAVFPGTTESQKTRSSAPESNTAVSTSSTPSARTREVNCVASAATSSTSVVPVPMLITTPVSETQTATPSANPIKTIETKVEDVAPIAPAKSPTPNAKISSCRIWNTQDLCSTPDSLKFPYGIECDGCEYSDDCKAMNGKKLTPVILRIYKKNGFRLEKGFHSISLVTSRGLKLEPFAISIDRYMTNVKQLGVRFKNVVDMIILFPQANPGDKVIIDGVVEAVIEN